MMRSLRAPRARRYEPLLRACAVLGALSLAACDSGDDGTNNTYDPSLGADAGTPGGSIAGAAGGVAGGVAGGGTLGGSLAGGGATGGGTPGGGSSGGAPIGGGTTGGAIIGGGPTGGGTTGGALTGGGPASGGATGGGTTGGATTGGTTGGGTTGGGMMGGAANKPPCLKKPSQVVALGDSYVSLPVVLIPKVEALAVSGGALTSGQHYRDYSAPGTTLGSPAAPGDIPPQWDLAKREDPDIKAIIMDGGGNDIIASVESLFAGCLDPGARQNQTCTGIIDGCMGVVRKLAMEAKAAGVKDVIYFLYPHVPLGGDDILDYSVEQAQKMTAELTSPDFRVHLIDTRATFMGHAEYFDIDPVHANEAGAQQIAKLVWEKMKSACIAQPASSGCCAP